MRVAGDEERTEPTPEEMILTEAKKRWREFFNTHEKTIGAYLGTTGIPFSFEPGGWYIDLKKIRVNADPEFFIGRGFSESEALFATFHEAEHFRDMISDPDAYEVLFDRIDAINGPHPAYNKALSRLYNCLDDVLVNRVVMNRWKAGSRAKETLYHKLFPNTDFRGQPRHRQLMYAILREAMLPNEPCQIDQDVRKALSDWQARGGRNRSIDILTSVDPRGNATFDPQNRFFRIRQTLEPIFKAFYEQDLVDRRQQEDKENKLGGKPQKSGDGDPFGKDPNQDTIPDPLDFKDAAEEIKKLNDRISQVKKNKFEQVMGVSQEDFDAYKKDFLIVAPFVNELSEVFRRVIQKRKEYRRVLRRSVKEGPMLDPRRAATAVAEIRAGNLEPRVMLGPEKRETIRNRPNRIELTLVCDGSGSMNEAAKKQAQRCFAVLAMEGFAKFRDEVERERRAGQNIVLDILSGLRIFGDNDEVVKPLSKSLSHQDRVSFRKKLSAEFNQGNNEPKTFAAIEQDEFTPDSIAAMRRGDLKKIIVFLTDGESDSGAIQNCIRNLENLARDPKTGVCNLVIAGIGFAGGESAKNTYAPNGYFAENLGAMPKIFIEFLSSILEDV
ncbi:TPA: hypothetical protein DEA21_04665 [Candidatus Uhrbacteria bacterium]|nr:hypothetical protein [Candidatus Uhrbacteria bacterium]